MKTIIKRSAAVTAALMVFLFSAICYYSSELPDLYYISDSENSISICSAPGITVESSGSSLAASGSCSDRHINMKMMLFHIIPVKTVQADTVTVPLLIPSGMPFGIKMLMNGVMVVKTGDILTPSGTISPAEKAGIIPGDIIQSVNGETVFSNSDIDSITSASNGNDIILCITRNGQKKEIKIQPAYSSESGRYKLGIWVRDSSAGIGTVTYYDRSTGRFGGLGHPVCDSDTGQIVPLSSGEVMDVFISGVKKGVPGNPGELTGYFTSHDSCGSLSINNRYGVFGNIDDDYACHQEIPMAMKHEVKKGPAEIYSTTYGNEPEKYSIEIREINYSTDDSSKNMVIHITDPRLLKKSGGIVQGMSGSPIIQNGKLIGAVTHVFVNDPSSGYAVFCESMYETGRVS